MYRFVLLICFFSPWYLSGQPITWLSGCQNKTFCLNPNSCTEGNVFMTEKAVTECPNGQFLNYSYKIDLFNNGSLDIQVSDDTISGPFPVGTHKVIWRAVDNCANIGNCTYLFTIKDCSGPVMLCINSLSQNLEVPFCTSTFYPDDFILNVSDNCTPDSLLVYGIREVGDGVGFPAQNSVVFDSCDQGIHMVEIWVKDQNNLLNQCKSNVTVQDNTGSCPCNIGSDILLKGCLQAAGAQKLSNYGIRADLVATPASGPPVSLSETENFADSCYQLSFSTLPSDQTYKITVRARRNDVPLAGVSTFDLLQITKHILNVQPFQTLYQWLAADVNLSNSVTTFDIVETRKLILGIYDTFPVVPSWRFVRPLANPANFMSAVKDTYQITLPNLPGDTTFTGLNFVGIKMGDANLSASFSGDTDDRSPLLWTVEDRFLRAGEEVLVPVRSPGTAPLKGWQLALETDPLLAVVTKVEGLPADNYFYKDGLLRLLWFDPQERSFSEADPVVFRVGVRALQPARLSDVLSLNSLIMSPEAYLSDDTGRDTRMPVDLQFREAGAGEVSFFSPRPNPFRQDVTFSFIPAHAGEVRLEIFDLSGKRVYEESTPAEPGYRTLTVSQEQLPGSGVFVYRMIVDGAVFSGRVMRQ